MLGQGDAFVDGEPVALFFEVSDFVRGGFQEKNRWRGRLERGRLMLTIKSMKFSRTDSKWL